MKRRLLRRLLRVLRSVLIAALIAFFIGIPVVRAIDAVHPARVQVCCETPADWGFQFENVTFPSRDGVFLSGWYIPSQNGGTIILTHGYGSNRLGLADQAKVLAQHGFGVLMYDMRGHGDSAVAPSTRGWLEVNDVLGALDYLKQRPGVDSTRIGAFGFSIGGQATLRAAALAVEIKAVVADGASTATFSDEPPPTDVKSWINYPTAWVFYHTLGVITGVAEPQSVFEAVQRIAPRPLLLISTGQSTERDVERHYFAAAQEPKTLWEIPETGHGGGFAARPQEYSDRLVSFFQNGLGVK